MDLNFKNVARYVAEHIEEQPVDETRVIRLHKLNPRHLDAYAMVYLTMINLGMAKIRPSLNLNIVTYRFSGYDPLVFKQMNSYDELKFQLNETVSLASSLDTDIISDTLNDLFYESKFETFTSIKVIKESVSEVLFNVQSHTSEPFSLVRFSYYEDNGYFDIVIGDIGEGIKKTLIKKALYSDLSEKEHFEAIRMAMDMGVTSKTDSRGYGLYEIKKDFLSNKTDLFFISSGDGYFMVDHNLPKSPYRAGNLRFGLPGVQVLLRFGCEKNNEN